MNNPNTISQIQVGNTTYTICDPTVREAGHGSGGQILTLTSDFAIYNNLDINALRYSTFGPLVALQGQLTPTQNYSHDLNEHVITTLPAEVGPLTNLIFREQSTGYGHGVLSIHYDTGTVTESRYSSEENNDGLVAGRGLPIQAMYIKASYE